MLSRGAAERMRTMPMRDYEDLKNLKIPAEQERIMDIPDAGAGRTGISTWGAVGTI